MSKALLILGAGGHGRVVREVALFMVDSAGMPIYEKVDFLDDNAPDAIGSMTDLGVFADQYTDAFCGIGNNVVRDQLQQKAVDAGFNVPVLIHPTAYVSPTAVLGAGTIVEPRAIVNAGAVVGRGCILSVGSIVDHDSAIGDFCHVNTGAICMAGSTVEPGRKVGAGEVVGGFNAR